MPFGRIVGLLGLVYLFSFLSGSALVSRFGRSENSLSHFKLILYCFLPNISPRTEWYSNWIKNTDVKNICYGLVLVGRSSQAKNSRSQTSHLKLMVCCSLPKTSSHTKSNQKLTKQGPAGQRWVLE